MNKMRFWYREWPNNPSNIRVRYEKNARVQGAPFGNAVIQNLGNNPRVVTGEGDFFGPNARITFLNMIRLQRHNLSHLLRLPEGFAPFHAFFTRFEFIGQPGPGIVRYSFEFIEDTSRFFEDLPSAGSSHTVTPGDTLWSIAAMYNISVETLLNINVGIDDGQNLTVGGVIRLR